MTSRDPELQRLIDESAIRKLLDSYPRALDRQDHELHASLYHPDAIDDHGFYNGPATGYVAWIKAAAEAGRHWTHHNGTQLIDIDGEVARTETYCLALCRIPATATQGEREILLRCRYVDRSEKRQGVWKIAHRRVVYSPCQILSVVEEFPMAPECIREGMAGLDAIYSR